MSAHGRRRTRLLTPQSPLSLPRLPVGFDPLVAGRPRRSGLLPSFKAPPGGSRSYIFTSSLEWQLGLWLELHPRVVEYGRVDVHEDAARIRRIRTVAGFELRCPVRFESNGVGGYVLPDAGARFVDGSPGLFEAGVFERKSTDEARAALAAARAAMAAENGVFGLLLAGGLNRRWFVRGLWLHMWRFAYYGSEELLADIEAAWLTAHTPRQLIAEFAHRDREAIVTHAVMKTAGDALAAGRLRYDPNRADFDLDTITALRGPDESSVVPEPLPVAPPDHWLGVGPESEEEAGPPIWLNPEHLDADRAAVLLPRRAAMERIKAGEPAAQFAEFFGVSHRRVQQIHANWLLIGDTALLPWASADHRGSRLPDDVKRAVRRALSRAPGSTGTDIARDPAVEAACILSLGRVPRADRFSRYLDELRRDDPRFRARPSGRGRVTDANAAGFTAIYGNRPGFIVEYDGEKTNLLAQILPGLPDTERVQRLKAKDVATSCPVGETYSLDTPDQGEQRRLLLRVSRPKDGFVARAESANDWPLHCWPMVWAGDNAWINEAGMFLTQLPELGVCVVFEPAKRPESKGTIESGIGKDQKLHQDRQPNSTGRAPGLTDGRRPARYAAEHGIGLPDVEADGFRQTIDGDLWGPNKRLRCRPIDLWQAGARKYPVRTWEGPDSELVRRLRRPLGTRTMSGGRVSHNNRDYVMRWTGDADDDPRNELPYPVRRKARGIDGQVLQCTIDDDDVRTLDAYDPETGVSVTLVCNRLREYGRPVSEFELGLEQLSDADLMAEAKDSRETAAAATLRKNRNRPRKRVAKSIVRQRGILARAHETRGTEAPTKARRPPRRTTEAPADRDQTTAYPTFHPRPGNYASPTIHRPPGDATREPGRGGES
jgi:hypothetical protein